MGLGRRGGTQGWSGESGVGIQGLSLAGGAPSMSQCSKLLLLGFNLNTFLLAAKHNLPSIRQSPLPPSCPHLLSIALSPLSLSLSSSLSLPLPLQRYRTHSNATWHENCIWLRCCLRFHSCCLRIFRVTIWPWRASFSTLFHPVTQRLLSIYALHREIGLNAYVKDPIKVARRTPCDVSIASGKPGTHMPRFPCLPCHAPVWSQIRFPNPINDSLPLRREVENFLRTRNEREKFHFQFGNFFRLLWESLHTSRRIWSFAFFLRLPSDLTHLYAI